MVQRTPCFGRSNSFSPRCTVCPGTNLNLNFWKRRAMRTVALSEEKTLPMQTLGPQEKGKYTKFEMLFLSLAENLSGIKLSGLFQCWGEWWDTKMEKLIFVPLGIWNGPNISGFVVIRTVPEAGGCLRRLSLRVCPRYSSWMVSPYSTVCFDPKSLSTSENNLSKIRKTTNINEHMADILPTTTKENYDLGLEMNQVIQLKICAHLELRVWNEIKLNKILKNFFSLHKAGSQWHNNMDKMTWRKDQFSSLCSYAHVIMFLLCR